jgi:peptidoglycan/LPS O-acetylase OafA/YrhL
MAALGRRSYALYLVHPFALFSTALAFDRVGLLVKPLAGWPFRIMGLLLTLGFAEAAHRFVEVPVLRTKDRLGAMALGVKGRALAGQGPHCRPAG